MNLNSQSSAQAMANPIWFESNTRIEHMIDLNMQDLVFDDEFIAALDEKESVSIQVVPQFGKTNG